MVATAGTRLVELPGRGVTRVWECPGPRGAETLMLIHGVTFTAELNWEKVFAPLAPHFRVVAMDLRGHGAGITGGEAGCARAADGGRRHPVEPVPAADERRAPRHGLDGPGRGPGHGQAGPRPAEADEPRHRHLGHPGRLRVHLTQLDRRSSAWP